MIWKSHKMKNVAIYVRYSSDLQNARSCEDQIQSCMDFIDQHPSLESKQSKVYSDAALSGQRMANRPAITQLGKDIETGQVSHVVTEGIDRISRSQEHIAGFYRICQYHRVQLLTVMEGPISDIHVGLKGTMSAVFLQEVAHRVRRGQKGNIREGKAAGGLPYGYRVKYINDAGHPEPGLREVDPEQARVVKQIYDAFCDGTSPIEIAKKLNNEGIPSPRNGIWSQTTIKGHYGRGNGILQNAIYKGDMVWNRNNFERHPNTGVRHVRQNARREWVSYYNPALRIIDDEQWQKVQDIMKATRQRKRPAKKQSYPEHRINVRCGRCGSRMHKHSPTLLVCGYWKRTRACDQSRGIHIESICLAVYEYLRGNLDTIWEKWRKPAEIENEARRKKRRENGNSGASIASMLIILDSVSQDILMNALASAENDPVVFIKTIIAEVSVDIDEGNIIITDLMPQWTALEDMK